MMLQLLAMVDIQAVEVPAASCTWANQISPGLVDIVANIRGVALVVALLIVVTSVALLAVVSPFEKARKRVISTAGWPVGVIFIGSAVIAILTSIIGATC